MTKELEDLMCRNPMVAMAAADDAVKTSIVLKGGGSAEQVLSWLTEPTTRITRYLRPKEISVVQTFSGVTVPKDCEAVGV